MPLNKKSLLNRLSSMLLLEVGWDGFGSAPITKKVFDVTKEMINLIDVDIDLQIFVGVEIDGSLYAEAYRPNKPKMYHIELTVLPEGIIDYTDIQECAETNGSFVLTYSIINEILH